MLFLIALIIAFSFAFFCGNALKKYPCVFYAGAVVLTAAMAFLPSFDTRELPAFVNNFVLGLFTRGALATALWCVVMITGALPNGSVPIKKLMPIRGELSIFTAILTLGHNIGYGRTYFVMLFTNADRMGANQIAAAVCTIVMLMIMIPLAVISFPQVRRKMNAKLWKKIQRTAYLFYALIYVHVMLLTIPLARMGRNGYLFSVLVYSIVFLGYAFFRIRKFAVKKEKTVRKIVTSTAFISALFCISLVTSASNAPIQEKSITSNSNVKSYSVNADASLTTEVQSETNVTAVSEKTNTSVKKETVTSEKKQTTASKVMETTFVSTNLSEETESAAVTSKSKVYTTTVKAEVYTKPAVTEKPTAAPKPTTSPPTEPPEPEYIYNNGDFSGIAYGYDGDVYVTVSIYNDVITNISGWSDESDSFYFDSASGQVIPSILSSQSTYVDACSGATYSSNAIMRAVQNALDSARR